MILGCGKDRSLQATIQKFSGSIVAIEYMVYSSLIVSSILFFSCLCALCDMYTLHVFYCNILEIILIMKGVEIYRYIYFCYFIAVSCECPIIWASGARHTKRARIVLKLFALLESPTHISVIISEHYPLLCSTNAYVCVAIDPCNGTSCNA